jgi:hypothetical protein
MQHAGDALRWHLRPVATCPGSIQISARGRCLMQVMLLGRVYAGYLWRSALRCYAVRQRCVLGHRPGWSTYCSAGSASASAAAMTCSRGSACPAW